MQPQQEAPSAAEESKLAKQVNEEYHDPYDDWSARDFLVSLVPFIVVFAFKDSALNAALAFGIAWSGLVLALRLINWDGRHKIIWPILDITNLVTLAILRGFTRRWYYWIHKWIPVIYPLVLAVTGIASIVWRRPFTAHYARYPKFDRGGRGLWHGDASFRRTSDLTMIGWITAWSIMLLLSLIPILVGYWFTWNALNVIFNYIVPFVLLLAALIYHQVMGSWYRSTATKSAATTLPTGRGVAQPAGTTTETGAAPTTYSSTAV